MNDWRSVDNDPPDWQDVGKTVEMRRGEQIITGELEAEAWFNGEDEIPILSVGKRSLYDFEAWRTV